MRKSKLSRFVAGFGALAMAASLCTAVIPQQSQTAEAATISYQMEALDRGLVAVKSDGGIFLSWRLLGTESYSTSFNVYRNGVKIAGPITNSTNYFDASGTTSNTYTVKSVVNGSEVTESASTKPWGNQYLDVAINKPADTTLSGSTVTYSANDATVADVDGDGAYEIILKWDPSNSKDNSQKGYTSNVYIDCYELDGTQLWRIDLGKNIRAGAHYTQMAAYDFDGDGKAELALKTADGTVDGQGNVIGNASTDNRNSSGYILTGSEYLTMFNGQTGKAMTTIDYAPARGTVSSWGDSYGNRVDRFLCGVAYLDGKTPSLIECRGYYAKSMLVAYKYSNGKFTKQWTFTADGSTNSSYRAQGAHALSIADVDSDGYDEIVYGSCVIDQDGTGLYTTSQGHGDALHCGDFDPDHAGLEVFMVHESTSSSVESVQMRDAKTGKTIWSQKRAADIGRGLIINAAKEFAPYVCLADYAYDSDGNTINSKLKNLGENFSMLWDDDLYQEGLDGTSIRKWNSSSSSVDYLVSDSSVHSCNSTKATPSLSGDILGDWREEVIWPTSDDKALRIYTTDDVTDSKLYTLVSDRQYREALAWQNVAYNQPPHTSYYISEDMSTPVQPSMYTVGSYSIDGSSGSSTTTSSEAATLIEGAIYTIQNVNSSKCLNVTSGTAANNTNIQQWGSAGGATYETFRAVSAGDGYYYLYSQVGDKTTYLLSSNYLGNKNVLLYTDLKSDAQLFKFEKNTDGSYYISCKADNTYLSVADSSTASGANVDCESYTGSDAQKWNLTQVTDPGATISTATNYQFKNVNSGLYFNVTGGTAADHTNLQQWGSSTPANYNTFKLASAGNGYYYIYSLVGDGSTYMVNVLNGVSTSGTNVDIAQNDGTSAVLFKFVKNADGSYNILTKASKDKCGLEAVGTASGGNIQQSTITNAASQHWVLESVAATASTTPSASVSETPVTTTTPASTTPVSSAPAASASTTTGNALTLDATASSWSGAYNMSVALKNTSSSAITDWKITLTTSEADITSIWCAEEAVSGTTITITPASYNAGIAASGSTSFGYGANGSVPSTLNYMVSYEMNGIWYSYTGADSSL